MSAAITVQRLRLKAPCEVSAVAQRARIEDALRISSKPVTLAHRFVLVRRLRLKLPRSASAQTLALQLEHEWRRIEALARPMAQADDGAEAVWAVDEMHARELLLDRWLAGRPAEAWYWYRLLATPAADDPLEQHCMRLLVEPFSEALPPQLEHLRQQQWLRRAWPRLAWAGLARAIWVLLVPVWRERLVAAVCPLALRLDTAALLPDVAASPAVPRAMPQPVPRAEASPTRFSRDPATAREPSRGETHALPAGAPQRALDVEAPRSALPDAQDARAAPPLRRSEAASPAHARVTPQPHIETVAEARASDWAGLWLLLPLLRRLGLSRESDPLPLFAALLQRVAQAHALDAPAAAWVAQVGVSAEERTVDAARVSDWWRRARLACMRGARLPLRRLLHRPGQVLIAPHRIDIEFALTQTHIGIRRAGFDIDPGYVPWLDAVVHFHYR